MPPTDPAWLSDRPGGCLLRVRVKPRASRDQLEDVVDGLLSVRLCSPPVDNQANSALVELLAKSLRLPKSSLTIVGGEKSRQKTVAISGLSAAEAGARLSRKK